MCGLRGRASCLPLVQRCPWAEAGPHLADRTPKTKFAIPPTLANRGCVRPNLGRSNAPQSVWNDQVESNANLIVLKPQLAWTQTKIVQNKPELSRPYRTHPMKAANCKSYGPPPGKRWQYRNSSVPPGIVASLSTGRAKSSTNESNGVLGSLPSAASPSSSSASGVPAVCRTRTRLEYTGSLGEASSIERSQEVDREPSSAHAAGQLDNDKGTHMRPNRRATKRGRSLADGESWTERVPEYLAGFGARGRGEG